MILDFKKNIETLGYALLPNLISEERCCHFKNLLENDYKKYSPYYDGNSDVKPSELSDKSGEKVVYNLHNKHLSWFELFEHPEILKLLDSLLKVGSYKNAEPYYLNNISARCPLKGGKAQQLHLDSNLPGINYTIIVNVIWMLDDFTHENGATRIVPHSHNFLNFAPDGINHHPDEILITGKKGSAIVFNANLWHGGTENTTHETRWAVALGYARWFIKPSFDFIQNTPSYIFDNMTDAQKNLLGFSLVPPKDEFTRVRRRSNIFETPGPYKLPEIIN